MKRKYWVCLASVVVVIVVIGAYEWTKIQAKVQFFENLHLNMPNAIKTK